MTPDERDAFLAESPVARVATLRADGSPDVTPLWFAWVDEAMWLSSLVRSQRWANVLRDPRVSAVVDDGESYAELRGVELIGHAEPVGEQPRAGEQHKVLTRVEAAYAAKYGVPDGGLWDGRHAWLRLTPTSELSWDHRKIAGLTKDGT